MPVPTSTNVSQPQSQTQLQNDQTQTQTQSNAPAETSSASTLPDGTLDFAARMFDLARQGDPSLLAYLAAGLPSDLTNSRGDTLLMLAAYHGHHQMVHSMLNPDTLPPVQVPSSNSTGSQSARQIKRADPNALNDRGQSPVAGAVFKGHDEVVKVLIQGGADPLAGHPNAEDTAKMFKRWEDAQNADGSGEVRKGFKDLFTNAIGRGKGATPAPPAVPDREQSDSTNPTTT